ncbi:MAG: RelA/SpoT family protein [Armatimonadota bacterium]
MVVVAEPMTARQLEQAIRAYWPGVKSELIQRAFDFASEAHAGQQRLTGDPYITHPLAVAGILVGIESDPQAIAGALLHDVLEDTHVQPSDVQDAFGPVIARLVEGVTNLTRIDFSSVQDEQAENLRKMFLAMAQDLRVITIKLGDRLHNMRTLHVFDREKRAAIATETLQIFAPLSHRLGVWKIKWELEDLCFRELHPEEYAEIVRKVNQTRGEREDEIQEAVAAVQGRLREAGVEADVHGRPKHFYSIYQKMLREGVDFDQVYDLTALRIICHTISDCYAALGLVHDLWMPIPGMFTDYIAKPKANKYQSLHTKVYGPRGQAMEVQIRSWAMHRVSEYGVAAHWRYKEGGSDTRLDEQLSWLRQLLELQTDLQESSEYLSSLKMALFRDEVFVFTPKGDVVDLPAGATPIDFAYRIHTEVGHHCAGAKVNGRMVSLDYQLKNGDIAEILTSNTARPSRDWLRLVQTSSAKSKIRRFLRQQIREENVERGRELLTREVQRLSARDLEQIDLEARLAELAGKLNLRSAEDVYAALGYGDLEPEHIVSLLKPTAPPATLADEAELVLPLGEERRPPQRASVSAAGVSGFQTRVSRCCGPLPGDDIVGYVTRGRGMAIHRADCKNLAGHARREPHRVVALDWGDDSDLTYRAEVLVDALDRVGLLSDISAIVSETQINIASAHVHTDNAEHVAQIHMSLDIRSRDHLDRLVRRLEDLSDVLRVRVPTARGS